MRVDKVTSGDGASISVYSTGAGPGIVILHGGGVAVRDYQRLATALSDRFTVHLYNRRGRPAGDYAGITAELLLTAGAGSPRYFMENCQAIADVTPRGRALLIPKSSHNAANVARPGFVRPFADFFAGSLKTA